MNILSRIKLPKSPDVSGLYVQCNEAVSINYHGDKEIVLSQGGIVSSNSYFNSFYEKFYAKYTILSSIYYLLKLEGDFQVSVYREIYGNNSRKLICQQNFEKCQLADYVKLLLPDILQDENAGRIYLEIKCCSEQGLFKEGLIATEQKKNREVSLAIISCTFKKEPYIKNTINTILEDNFLSKKDFKIFVVDNGKTLEDDLGLGVQLIPNKNMGGSGGFTRGLVEALQANTFSHFLFMDDDIELESESIYRLFSLYEYAKLDFAVAGSMLDLYKKHLLYEAGALYGKSSDEDSEVLTAETFSVAPLKHNIALESPNYLNLLLLEEHIDYGGFWFFCFSKELVEEIGLPMPFFIKVDDMEFGLRIRESLASKIVAFPSIAVWHEPFYAKFPIWDTYYHFRNSLITHAIHSSLGYIHVIKDITHGLVLALLGFDYNSAHMVLEAFEDYLKGPEFLKTNDPELLHSKVLKLSKSYKTQNIQQNYLPNDGVYQSSKPSFLQKILSLLTLNGHLLPNFLTTDEDVFILHKSGSTGQRSKAFAKKRIFIFKEETACLFQNEIDKPAGIKLMTKWFKLVARSSIKWSSISTQWKNAAQELTSSVFWHQYLGLKNKAQ